ncbi:isopentenyl-diphosphate delta-isomerase idi1 [Linnemannia gamsii]|uniref:isopentenyl-diphosphate Delta-isomerase n=1 Tax=Linnemannia gamsii TaxID=64522 RepID=A0ABQ7K6D6_9FUNG|nr:isopentenyl-diphosphate delta-isomerase idi1 [Linnemannia gamsii]
MGSSDVAIPTPAPLTSTISADVDLSKYDDEQVKLMEEMCIVIDRDDKRIGADSKKTCHLMKNIMGHNLLHRAFSVFLFSPDGTKLLLQQRATEKITFPDAWTNTCCSHPLNTADELIEKDNLGVRTAAQRKLFHELGIDPKDVPVDEFHFLTRIHYMAPSNETWGEHEIDYILFMRPNQKELIKMDPSPNEVRDVRWVTKDELKVLLEQGVTPDSGIIVTPWFKLICDNLMFAWWDRMIAEGDVSKVARAEESHVQCTESFYKSSVMEELKSSPAATPQDRKKMLGILDRFERQAVDEEQFLATMSDEDLLRHAHQQQKQPKYSSSGNPSGPGAGVGAAAAATSEKQRKLTPKEREELLREAMEEEAKEGALPDEGDDENIDPEERAEMERMVEQEYQDFVHRFAGVDLDQESFESVWDRLNPEERREFQEKFMISGRLNEDDSDDDQDDGVKGISDDDNEDERKEAKELLQEMGETLERGGQKMGSEGGQAMTADLDMDDLKAIRDAEIAELIQIWRPWWEIEAEEGGELKKVVVFKVTENEAQEKQDSERLKAASNIILQQGGSATSTATTGTGTLSNHPHSASNTVLEQFVLDEEAMLRPHQALVRPMEEVEQEAQRRAQSTVPPMTRAPHSSLIYHVCGLLFAFAATIRVFNGDLQEEPEQVLAHVFDLCPFFAPPPPSAFSKSSTPGSALTASATEVMHVEDFETTLAVLQTASLNSKLWKGDTARLEMLSLLLRDLTLILARPSRCLRCIQELEAVFQACLASFSVSATTTKRRGRLLSKTTLHRLLKKLEFYESYLLSEELLLKSDRLDGVRTEVVMSGIRVRQEMIKWNQELEQVSRVVVDGDGYESGVAAAAGEGSVSDSSGGSVKGKKVLIEELS